MATEEGCLLQIQSKSVRWQISNFRNLPQVNGQKIESPKFWVSDSKWQITFYLKGHNDEANDYISLFLAKLNGRNSFLASVTFSIYGKEQKPIKTLNFENNFVKEISSWGYGYIMNTQDFLKKCTLTIVCSVCDLENPSNESISTQTLNNSVINECSICDNKNLLKQSTSTQTSKLDEGVQALTKNLEDILVSNNFSDLKIKIQQKEFQAHRAILAARAPVFAFMFQHEMKEHLNGVLDITDCDAGSFQLFLLFLYTRKLDKTTNEHSINLYQTADKYGVIDLRQMCCDWMLESLELESVCDVIDLAMTYEELDLLKKAIEFFTVNAANIFQTQQWQNYLHQKPSVVGSILKQMSEVVGQILIKPRTDKNQDNKIKK